jgi:hypothetical protein
MVRRPLDFADGVALASEPIVTRARLAALGITVSALAATGCGTSSDHVTSAPRTIIRNSSAGVANQPIIRDITVLGKTAATGRTDDAIHAIYDLLAVAQSLPNDREGWKGLALIRTRLPRILDRYLATYSPTRAQLNHVRMETATGEALRAWLLAGYESQRRQFIQLRNELANGAYAWADVLRWSEGNNTATVRSNTRLSSILRALPATQQPSVNRAIAKNLG